jgi:hypothetical protein
MPGNASPAFVRIHHLVWGILILLLLGVGYDWLVEIASGGETFSTFACRSMSLLGAGAALTLDEFSLWLNLKDVHWARQGRESIDAIVLFGPLLLSAVWGGEFLLRARVPALPEKQPEIEFETRLRTRRHGTSKNPCLT